MSRPGKRERLFNKFKFCFHCKKGLKLTSDDPNDPSLAVLENKYSHFDRQRHIQSHSEYRYRLVCLECGRRIEKERQEKIPINIRQELTNSYPLLDLEGFRATIIENGNGRFVFIPDDKGPLWVTEFANPFLPDK